VGAVDDAHLLEREALDVHVVRQVLTAQDQVGPQLRRKARIVDGVVKVLHLPRPGTVEHGRHSAGIGLAVGVARRNNLVDPELDGEASPNCNPAAQLDEGFVDVPPRPLLKLWKHAAEVLEARPQALLGPQDAGNGIPKFPLDHDALALVQHRCGSDANDIYRQDSKNNPKYAGRERRPRLPQEEVRERRRPHLKIK